MSKRPFLLLACMFLAGALIKETGAWYLIAPAAAAFFLAVRGEIGWRRVLIALAVPALLIAGFARASCAEGFRSQYLPELSDGEEIRLLGEITRIEEKTKCVYYYLSDCTIARSGETVPTNGVIAMFSSEDYEVGQTVVIDGTVSLFSEAVNEGGFDQKSYYQSQKIDFGVWVSSAEIVPSMHRIDGKIRMWLARLRQRLYDSLTAAGAKDGILPAMLLGDKSDLDGEVKTLYQQAGISHILAISGLHVSMLGMGLYKLLRKFRAPRWLACGSTAVLMLSYLVMTGNGVSTRRAVGMLIVCLVADIFGKSYDMLSALGLLLIVLLWQNPFLVGYSGLIFSAVAVLGVGIAMPALTEWGHRWKLPYMARNGDEGRLKKFASAAVDALAGALAIQLATLPLVARFYYVIPVYAILVNTVVLALVKYLVGLGAAAAAVGLCSTMVAAIIMFPCNRILDVYEWLCNASLSLPGAQLVTGCPGAAKLILYYIILSAAMFLMHLRAQACQEIVWEQTMEQEEEESESGDESGSEPRDSANQPELGGQRANVLTGIGTASLVLTLLLVLLVHPARQFEIDMLDVGQGDGIYLCTGGGTSMFIDGGSTGVSSVGTYRILPFLQYKGIGKISYWFVSHTDADHVNGLTEVLESGYKVENIVFSKLMRGESATEEIAELAEENGANVLYMGAGDKLAVGDATLSCLYPSGDGQWYGQECSEDLNDYCLVLLYEEDGFKGLFTGDIPAEAEAELLASGLCQDIDFYKAAHHGSKYSNSYDYLQALSPEVAAISCGAGNTYGHPGAEAVANMEATGADVLCTIECGRIRIYKRHGRYYVDTYL